MQYLPFSLLLLGALLLSMSFAHLQHRYYVRAVNRLAAQYRQAGYVLCSGIARGRLRGAIAILIIRTSDDTIERAEVMEGSSILARFRERARLRDQPLDALNQLHLSKASQRAMQDAAERYRKQFASVTATQSAETEHSAETLASPPQDETLPALNA